MKKITAQQLLIFLFCAALIALTAAYISQYFFGLQPCPLCLHQRKPFFAIILLCLGAFTFFKSQKSQKIILFCCAIALLINCAVAAYHVGVEKKIIKGPATCSSENLNEINDLKELEDKLLATNAVKCDEPQFVFLALSMAAWNLVYCGLLLLIILIGHRVVILQIFRNRL